MWKGGWSVCLILLFWQSGMAAEVFRFKGRDLIFDGKISITGGCLNDSCSTTPLDVYWSLTERVLEVGYEITPTLDRDFVALGIGWVAMIGASPIVLIRGNDQGRDPSLTPYHNEYKAPSGVTPLGENSLYENIEVEQVGLRIKGKFSRVVESAPELSPGIVRAIWSTGAIDGGQLQYHGFTGRGAFSFIAQSPVQPATAPATPTPASPSPESVTPTPEPIPCQLETKDLKEARSVARTRYNCSCGVKSVRVRAVCRNTSAECLKQELAKACSMDTTKKTFRKSLKSAAKFCMCA